MVRNRDPRTRAKVVSIRVDILAWISPLLQSRFQSDTGADQDQKIFDF